MSIKSDGYICPPRDPPGQRSIYILPGDPRCEVYWLSTFLKYPANVQIEPWKLAKAGFYYTGYKDRVKCSRCARQVAEWQAGEDPCEAKWHEVYCQLEYNNLEHNIPISSVRQLRPVTTSRPAIAVRAPIGGPSGNATSVEDTEGPVHRGEVPRSAAVTRHVPQTTSLRHLFPCESPINPHMASVARRLETFTDHLGAWHRNNIRAIMSDMAEAGLYYLGERDKVKCWYCNGGLQNWHVNDEPWFEHAKWFPTCEFLLRNKGPEYVSQVTARFPNIGRNNDLTRSM